jgi:hypothetical protein
VLTIDQKPQRIEDSEECLAIFNRNKDEFFRRYIIMDVTWLLRNTTESNQQSVEWTERDEPSPKHGKTQPSQLARLWHKYSGMRVVLHSSITSKRARSSTASIT